MLRQPFNRLEFERLQRDMDRLFEATFPIVQRQRVIGIPAVNVWANKDDGLIITAELPGFEPEDVEIAVTGDTLTQKGSRQPVELSEQAQYHRRERTHGEFTRKIQLPYSVNTEMVEATMEQGILHISLPRADAEKPKQIAVKASR